MNPSQAAFFAPPNLPPQTAPVPISQPMQAQPLQATYMTYAPPVPVQPLPAQSDQPVYIRPPAPAQVEQPAPAPTEQEPQAAVAQVNPYEVKLLDGRTAVLRRAKGRDLDEVQKLGIESDVKLGMAMVARLTTINNRALVYEDLLDMDLEDVNALLNRYAAITGK